MVMMMMTVEWWVLRWQLDYESTQTQTTSTCSSRWWRKENWNVIDVSVGTPQFLAWIASVLIRPWVTCELTVDVIEIEMNTMLIRFPHLPMTHESCLKLRMSDVKHVNCTKSRENFFFSVDCASRSLRELWKFQPLLIQINRIVAHSWLNQEHTPFKMNASTMKSKTEQKKLHFICTNINEPRQLNK